MIKIIRTILFIIGSILVIDYLVISHALGINLGAIVPLFIGIIFLVHAVFWKKITCKTHKNRRLRLLWKGCWGLFFLWLISFVVFISYLKIELHAEKQTSDIDAIIVLGAGVNGSKPSRTLASRLDTAVTVFEEHPSAVIITSGGIGIGRTHSEALVMANYLIGHHGVDANKILLEERSTSTETNLAFSTHLLALSNIDVTKDNIAIVTSDFHTIRAKAIANKQGYINVFTFASTTPAATRPNAWFREYFAFFGGLALREH